MHLLSLEGHFFFSFFFFFFFFCLFLVTTQDICSYLLPLRALVGGKGDRLLPVQRVELCGSAPSLL